MPLWFDMSAEAGEPSAGLVTAMMSLPKKNLRSRLANWVENKKELFQDEVTLAGKHKVLHFFYLIFRNFDDNRCLSRAGAMTFSTILAIVPTLAIVISYAPKQMDDQQLEKIITGAIDYFAPTLAVDIESIPTPASTSRTNQVEKAHSPGESNPDESSDNSNLPAKIDQTDEGGTDISDSSSTADPPGDAVKADDNPNEPHPVLMKQQIVDGIMQFTQNYKNANFNLFATLAFLGMVFSTLITTESVMNDIWDSVRGRSWPARLMSYWVVISLSGFFLAGAALLLGFQDSVHRLPGGSYMSTFGIILFIGLALTALYRLMPNADVKWLPALIGGGTAAMLLQLNKWFIPVFVAGRAVREGQIYGSFLAVLLFMFGTYIAWVIVLFGAQVSATFQNRKAYLHGIQSKSVHQYGRETSGFRIMAMAARSFLQGSPPPTIDDISREGQIPTPLVQELVDILVFHKLIRFVEVAQHSRGIVPSRPVETISCFDILDALRKAKGQDLDGIRKVNHPNHTCLEEDRIGEVLGEFRNSDQINASQMTLKDLVNAC